jgi:hypothetical protein
MKRNLSTVARVAVLVFAAVGSLSLAASAAASLGELPAAPAALPSLTTAPLSVATALPAAAPVQPTACTKSRPKKRKGKTVINVSCPTRVLAAATTMTVQSPTEFAGPDINPCTGETVAVVGTLNRHFHITINDDGSLLVEVHLNFAGFSGTALVTNAQYIENSTFDNIFQVHGNGMVEFSTIFQKHMIRQGSLGAVPDDFLLHFVDHVVIHGDGTVSAQVSKERENICQ